MWFVVSSNKGLLEHHFVHARASVKSSSRTHVPNLYIIGFESRADAVSYQCVAAKRNWDTDGIVISNSWEKTFSMIVFRERTENVASDMNNMKKSKSASALLELSRKDAISLAKESCCSLIVASSILSKTAGYICLESSVLVQPVEMNGKMLN